MNGMSDADARRSELYGLLGDLPDAGPADFGGR